MGTFKSSIGRSAVLAAGLLVSGFALNAARADECAKVHGTLSSTFYAQDCTSPVGVCTGGSIVHGGLLNGSDNFVATSLTPTDVPGTFNYTGVLDVTTKHGTVTLAVSGTINWATGAFTENDQISGGTGLFSGATGMVTATGGLKQDGSGFISQLGGSLCVADDGND